MHGRPWSLIDIDVDAIKSVIYCYYLFSHRRGQEVELRERRTAAQRAENEDLQLFGEASPSPPARGSGECCKLPSGDRRLSCMTFAWSYTARTGEQLDQQCSQQTYHHPNQPH